MTTNGTMGEAVKMISNSFSKELDVCGPSCTIKCWKWDVAQITMNTAVGSNIKYAILILNRPIPQIPGFVKRLWNNASIRMTVDGGTKQWDKFISSLPDDMKKGIKIPDLVTGDFDSITDEILEKYKKKGYTHSKSKSHRLYKSTKGTKYIQQQNRNGIVPRYSGCPSFRSYGPNIRKHTNIVPTNEPLKFGGIVSTSNTFDGSEKVTIKCSDTLLWSMKVPTIMIP